MAETEVAQTANFAVQVGLAELWRTWGIEPDGDHRPQHGRGRRPVPGRRAELRGRRQGQLLPQQPAAAGHRYRPDACGRDDARDPQPGRRRRRAPGLGGGHQQPECGHPVRRCRDLAVDGRPAGDVRGLPPLLDGEGAVPQPLHGSTAQRPRSRPRGPRPAQRDGPALLHGHREPHRRCRGERPVLVAERPCDGAVRGGVQPDGRRWLHALRRDRSAPGACQLDAGAAHRPAGRPVQRPPRRRPGRAITAARPSRRRGPPGVAGRAALPWPPGELGEAVPAGPTAGSSRFPPTRGSSRATGTSPSRPSRTGTTRRPTPCSDSA